MRWSALCSLMAGKPSRCCDATGLMSAPKRLRLLARFSSAETLPSWDLYGDTRWSKPVWAYPKITRTKKWFLGSSFYYAHNSACCAGQGKIFFAYFLEGNENAAMLRASFMPQTCPSFVDLLMLFTFSAYSSNLVILLKGYRGANGA